MKKIILFFVGFLARLHILTPIRVAQLKYMYMCRCCPHFRHPHDINEKINWLKFYGDTSQWPLLADKYRVREYVKECGFEEILIPLTGKWDSVEEIDWDKLPQQFVMKCNNGSGDVVVCADKGALDKVLILQHFRKTLQSPYGILTGEEHYKSIKPCIIAEELLDGSTQPNKSQSLVDYKIWTFDGKPEFIVCYSNRHNNYYCEIGVYDCNWEAHPEFLRYTSHYMPEHKLMPEPACLGDMLCIASRLSKGHPQMRVDLYEVNGHIYFGELTLTSSGGYMSNFTQEFLDKLGRLTVLPIDKK
ncbi:MAG: glycosyltransferase [Bacteroidales bacterium]|nr:glycosyltransferase [Bacteroidales bacterium]